MRDLVMEIAIFLKYSDVFELLKENDNKTLYMVQVAAVHCLYSHKTFNSFVKYWLQNV